MTDLDPSSEEALAAADQEQVEQEQIEADGAEPEPAAAMVGFLGCPREGLLRVKVEKSGPFSVACPCGEVHTTAAPMTRDLLDHEEVPELQALPPKQSSGSGGGRGSAQRKVSDEAIFDAIPAGRWHRASEVAEALGYAQPTTLTARLKRMNDSAESFLIAAHPGQPAHVARPVPDPGRPPIRADDAELLAAILPGEELRVEGLHSKLGYKSVEGLARRLHSMDAFEVEYLGRGNGPLIVRRAESSDKME